MTIDLISGKHRPAQILLVEDNIGDVMLTKRAFKTAKIANQITVAQTGEEAIALLEKENALLPDLILLDLNLPQMSGREVLSHIKNSHFRHIPVIVLSSSKAEQDVLQSYDLHANGYVIKPISIANFTDVIRKIEDFWFSLVVLPDNSDCQKQEIHEP